MRLSTAQIKQFEHDGYVLADGFLEADEVTHLQDCYMATVDRLSRENALQNVQSGNDHDAVPLQFCLPRIERNIDVGFYSRKRVINEESSFSVLG